MLAIGGSDKEFQYSQDGIEWTSAPISVLPTDSVIIRISQVGDRFFPQSEVSGYSYNRVCSTPAETPGTPSVYLTNDADTNVWMALGGAYYRFWWEWPTTSPYFYIEHTNDLDGAWSAFDFGGGDNYITDFTPVAVATPSRLVFLGGNIDGNRYLTSSAGPLQSLPDFPSAWRSGLEYSTIIPLQVERDPDTGLLVAMVQANDLMYVYPRFLMVSGDEGDAWTFRGEIPNSWRWRSGDLYPPKLHIGGGSAIFTGDDADLHYCTIANLAGTGDLVFSDAAVSGFNVNAVLYDPAYGQYVAVGDGGGIATSPDLAIWTDQTAGGGYSGDFESIAFYETGGPLVEPEFGPPLNVHASDGTYTNRVMVTWDAVANAAGYEVWRATSDDSALAEQQGTDVADAFYSDPYVEAGVIYYYWVKAKNAAETTDLSTGDSGYVRSASDLDASSENAERQGLIAQYNFADWKFLTKSTGDIMVDPVQEGVDYFCKLRSVSIFGKKQPFDAAYTVHRRIIGRLETYPPDLTGLTAVPSGDTVTIFADALTDPDIDGYEIRLGGSWEGGIFISYNKAPNTRLVGVRPGVHTFWMAARNNAGNYSLHPANASCRVFIPPGYSPFGIDPAETFDYASGSFDNTQRIITPPGSTSNPLLMVTHSGDVLTGTWVSEEHDLGSAIQCRVWGDFATQFATESMYWDNVIPDPTTWRDVGADNRTWAEIIGLSNIQRAGRLKATLFHRVLPTDPWYEVDYFEILCAEVEARYLRVGVELTDPGLEAHLYLQALNLSVYIW